MSTVAEQLCQARQAQNLTVYQVAEVTKIRTDHIRALEAGSYEGFSAPVYIRGFVRSYATVLKLDVPQVMAALDTELRQTEKFREASSQAGAGRGPLDFLMFQLSKVNWNKGLVTLGVVVFAVAALIACLLWRHAKTADPLKEAKPGLYQPAQTPGDTLPLPPASPRKP
jgi:cytoskeleton protein RodZ